MHAPPSRTLPTLEPETGWFWTGGERGELLIQRCTDCGIWQHPPLPRCAACTGENLAPVPTSGRGRIASFTINHEAWIKGLEVPFVFAAIELDEQSELYVFSNVLAAVDDVASGQRVEVCFKHCEDVWLPMFRPLPDIGS